MDGDPLPVNLRRVRVAKGLSQVELAKLADLSRVAYRSIETGKAQPRVNTLTRLADALNVKIEHLLSPTRTLTKVRFRARKKMNSRKDTLVHVARWLDDYAELEKLLRDKPQFKFEPLALKLARIKPGPARAIHAAFEARTLLNLKPRDSIRDVCGLLEDHGIKVFPFELASTEFFGLSISKDEGGPALVVNVWDRISVERWIFTAIHELGHILLHLHSFDVDRDKEDKAEEDEANLFASHFLMPEDVFLAEWNEARGLSLVERVLKVKRIFKVSWRTVLYRAFPNDKWIWQRFPKEYLAATGKELGPKDEPRRLSRSEFTSDRRDRLIRRAVDDGEISLSRAAEILGISVDKMHERAASWVE